MAQYIIASDFFRIAPGIPVNPFKHEFAKAVHRILNLRGHAQMRLIHAGIHQICNHPVNSFPVCLPEYFQEIPRNIINPDNPAAERVVQIMIQIGDTVCTPDTFTFQRVGHLSSRMRQDSITDFPGQIQAFSIVFKPLDDPKTLLVMAETVRKKRIERTLSYMPIGSMPQIMPQGDCFGQVFVQAQRPGDCSRYLGNLKRMRQAGAVMITFRRQKNLRFEFKPPERFTVDDSVTIPLEFCTQVTRCNRRIPAGGFCGMHGEGGKKQVFLLFKTFPDCQEAIPPVCLTGQLSDRGVFFVINTTVLSKNPAGQILDKSSDSDKIWKEKTARKILEWLLHIRSIR